MKVAVEFSSDEFGFNMLLKDIEELHGVVSDESIEELIRTGHAIFSEGKEKTIMSLVEE